MTRKTHVDNFRFVLFVSCHSQFLSCWQIALSESLTLRFVNKKISDSETQHDRWEIPEMIPVANLLCSTYDLYCPSCSADPLQGLCLKKSNHSDFAVQYPCLFRSCRNVTWYACKFSKNIMGMRQRRTNNSMVLFMRKSISGCPAAFFTPIVMFLTVTFLLLLVIRILVTYVVNHGSRHRGLARFFHRPLKLVRAFSSIARSIPFRDGSLVWNLPSVFWEPTTALST
jgi:hypothetical protein